MSGRLCIVGVPPVEWDKILQNKEECKRRGFPRISLLPEREGRLAVVGGGPSVLSHLNQIRECDEVWGINGAHALLRSHGIDSWLYAMDPDPIVIRWAKGATKAILCDRVCPEAFDEVSGEILSFELVNDVEGGIVSGSSTASAAFSLGTTMGWRKIDFFGCESSFDGDTHAYMSEDRKDLVWVEVEGKSYKTAPDFYLQAQEMAMPIRHLPNHFRHFGGGLLQALIDCPEHEVTHVSRAFMEKLNPA